MNNGLMTLLGLLVLVLLCLVVLEVGLRSLFGFGRPLIYVADDRIGYLLAPGQETRRFGNYIVINQYSMRSSEVTPTRTDRTLRILLLGDSIANGGWWTDQADTISALLQQQLETNLAGTPFQQVEVLNASANSWSPRNEVAYLQRFGSFDAQLIILLINTDDLFATAPTPLPVGLDRNYPNRLPSTALEEVIQRYLIKPEPIPELEALQKEGGDRVGANLAAIEQIQTIATQSQAQLLLALTPLLRETRDSGPRDYELRARERLVALTQQAQLPFLDFLPLFTRTPSNALYRDHIHLSPAGNQLLTQQIEQHIWQILEKKD